MALRSSLASRQSCYTLQQGFAGLGFSTLVSNCSRLHQWSTLQSNSFLQTKTTPLLSSSNAVTSNSLRQFLSTQRKGPNRYLPRAPRHLKMGPRAWQQRHWWQRKNLPPVDVTRPKKKRAGVLVDPSHLFFVPPELFATSTGQLLGYLWNRTVFRRSSPEFIWLCYASIRLRMDYIASQARPTIIYDNVSKALADMDVSKFPADTYCDTLLADISGAHLFASDLVLTRCLKIYARYDRSDRVLDLFKTLIDRGVFLDLEIWAMAIKAFGEQKCLQEADSHFQAALKVIVDKDKVLGLSFEKSVSLARPSTEKSESQLRISSDEVQDLPEYQQQVSQLFNAFAYSLLLNKDDTKSVERALQICDALAEREIEDATTLHLRILALTYLGHFREVKVIYDRLRDLEAPWSHEVFSEVFTHALMATNRIQDAKVASDGISLFIDELIEAKQPPTALACTSSMELATDVGAHSEAIEIFDLMLARPDLTGPPPVQAWKLLMKSLSEQGDVDKALRYLDKLRVLKPTSNAPTSSESEVTQTSNLPSFASILDKLESADLLDTKISSNPGPMAYIPGDAADIYKSLIHSFKQDPVAVGIIKEHAKERKVTL